MRLSLYPKVLSRIDKWLILYHPYIWRTRVHMIIYVATVISVMLFTSGFLLSSYFTDLLIPAIRPLEVFANRLFLVPSAFILIIYLFWVRHQSKFKLVSFGLKDYLGTFICYIIGVSSLFTSAVFFLLGVLIQTAHFKVNERDLVDYNKNLWTVYGVNSDEMDTLNTFTYEKSELERRAKEFKRLVEHEELLLKNRYNNDFIKMALTEKKFPDQFDSYKSGRSLLSLESAVLSLYFHRVSIENDKELFSLISYLTYPRLSEITSSECITCLPEIIGELSAGNSLSADIQGVNDPTALASDFLFLLDYSYRGYYLFRQDGLINNRKILQLMKYLANDIPKNDEEITKKYIRKELLSSYYDLVKPKLSDPKVITLLDSYNIPYRIDTIEIIKNLNLLTPIHFYKMEKLFRTVNHARLYLNEWVILRFYKALLLICIVGGLLILASSFITFNGFLGGSVILGLILLYGIILDINNWFWFLTCIIFGFLIFRSTYFKITYWLLKNLEYLFGFLFCSSVTTIVFSILNIYNTSFSITLQSFIIINTVLFLTTYFIYDISKFPKLF